MEALKAGWTFAKENDFRTILRTFNGKDAHPLLQFVKYGCCGLFAVAVHNVVFGILSYWINPAIDDGLGDSVRAIRATVNNCIAFVFSNCAAYYTNVKWVFVQGRHKPLKEFFIFGLVSSLSFAAGLLIVPFLIRGFGARTWIAQAAFIVTSALINFVSRKFFVFQR